MHDVPKTIKIEEYKTYFMPMKSIPSAFPSSNSNPKHIITHIVVDTILFNRYSEVYSYRELLLWKE